MSKGREEVGRRAIVAPSGREGEGGENRKDGRSVPLV